jgi:molecular chaperone IbpA
MVGFDRLFDLLENGAHSTAETYPPFDLVQDGDDRYRITLAVAGFRPDEIDITAQQNLLIVSGRKDGDEERGYVHRGIAARSFERRFVLGDYVKVHSADMRDGLLSVELVREVPEEMKPRKIEIRGGTSQPRLADQQPGTAANQNQQEAVAA